MKIKVKNIEQQAPVLGHIKIGGRKKSETKMFAGKPRVIPVKYDHFVVTTNYQNELGYIQDDELMKKLLAEQAGLIIAEHTEPVYDERGNLIKTIQTISRDQITEENKRLTRIVVMLPFDSADDNLVTSLAVYDEHGVRCRGDNETAEYIDIRTGEVTEIKCPCNLLAARLSMSDKIETRPKHPMGLEPEPKRNLTCKVNGILRVFLKQARTLGGIHMFRTTSINSIRQLLFAMNQISKLTGGFLAGIPLTLELQSKKVSPGLNKKLQTIYTVALTRHASHNEFLKQVVESTSYREALRKQLASGDIIKQLPEPGKENIYEAWNIQQEYYNPDGEIETPLSIEGEIISTVDPIEEEAYTKLESEADPKNALAEALSSPQEPQKSEAPPETPGTENETPAKSEASEQPRNPVVTFGRFPAVDTTKYEGADESKASKEARKAFFAKLKEVGTWSDEEVRDWIMALWNVQSSSLLEAWQITAMLNALA